MEVAQEKAGIKRATAKQNIVATIRFVAYSLIGIGAFFFSFELGGENTFLVNHIGRFIKTTFHDYLPYVVILIASGAVIQIVRRDPKCFKDSVSIFLSIYGFSCVKAFACWAASSAEQCSSPLWD